MSKIATKLNYDQLIEYKLYKNINTYNDQVYMKVHKAGGLTLITGSRYSDYRFQSSSATRTGKVFIDMNNELEIRR